MFGPQPRTITIFWAMVMDVARTNLGSLDECERNDWRKALLLSLQRFSNTHHLISYGVHGEYRYCSLSPLAVQQGLICTFSSYLIVRLTVLSEPRQSVCTACSTHVVSADIGRVQ